MKHYMCKIVGDVDDRHSDNLRDILKTACVRAGAKIAAEMQHYFIGQGVTIIFVLAESHASIHTWPEHGFAMVDYFSCAKEPGIEKFESVLETHFEVQDAITLDR
jgi:S-adenosylmethionine decarboxylase proenzyme